MRWSDAVPNLVIGLREGLEMGLVVTILLAAIRKLTVEGDQRSRKTATRPLWFGVVAALGLSLSFGAILTFSTAELSNKAQAAVGGILSVLAVGLVTAMIFWMRRTASTLSAQLRGEVERALTLGSGAIALTAFLAVAREGLETTLFIWTAVKASGDTVSPLTGGATGLVIAGILCWLLYRRAIHFNLGVFFNRTAIFLIVIAAGILAYGLGDIQEAGMLPGYTWTAFDLTAHISPTTWWVSITSGLTNLTPRMSWLQVVAWVLYLAVVLYLFVRAGRPVKARLATPGLATSGLDTPPAAALDLRDGENRWVAVAARYPKQAVVALLTAPALIAVVVIVAQPSSSASANITVTADECAAGWSQALTGTQTFGVTNKAGMVGEIVLLDAAGGIAGEIETLGPATTSNLTATLGARPYHFQCSWSNGRTIHSAEVTPSGASVTTPLAVRPASIGELTPAATAYVAYATERLADLTSSVQSLRSALAAGDRGQAQKHWLAAQLAWEVVGASYNSFGDPGVAIDGLPSGFPEGVNDPTFTGLHRIEYGLFTMSPAPSPSSLVPVADALLADVEALRGQVDEVAGDPVDLTLRAHEILEDAQRDHLSGIDNFGGNAAYPMTYANVAVSRVVWNELREPILSRNPELFTQAIAAFDRLDQALLAVRADGVWLSPAQASVAQRAQINAALGAALEVVAPEPGLLEVPKRATQ